MGQNFITTTLGWKLATLLAVLGGGLALGGSFYAGKQVGSSKPPTVIRLPPRLMPVPVNIDQVEVGLPEAEISRPQTSPAMDPQARPSRFRKNLPVPAPEKRSQAADALQSGNDKT
jgi:hypothetical protein